MKQPKFDDENDSELTRGESIRLWTFIVAFSLILISYVVAKCHGA